jgi:hypothetical protein
MKVECINGKYKGGTKEALGFAIVARAKVTKGWWIWKSIYYVWQVRVVVEAGWSYSDGIMRKYWERVDEYQYLPDAEKLKRQINGILIE